MGSAHDIMQAFTGRDLHAHFPEYEGWEWTALPPERSGMTMYRVTRGYHYMQESAVLSVSLEFRPSEESVASLMAVPDGRNARRYLLVPQGADVSHVPPGIRVLTMASFGFTDGRLTWLSKKKNALRYPAKETASA